MLIASALTITYHRSIREADFNFTNKAIGKKTAEWAKQNKEGFAEEQGGSRKNFRAVEVALNKVLTYGN
jgi:hypothetical protein